MGRPKHRLELPETAIFRWLWRSNLIVLAALVLGALLWFGWRQALGVLVGGAIALANYQLLKRSVQRTLQPGQRSVLGRMLGKYYLRFAATIAVLVILIRQDLVEPLGLIAGLSVVIVGILIWAGCQAVKGICKEAV